MTVIWSLRSENYLKCLYFVYPNKMIHQAFSIDRMWIVESG